MIVVPMCDSIWILSSSPLSLLSQFLISLLLSSLPSLLLTTSNVGKSEKKKNQYAHKKDVKFQLIIKTYAIIPTDDALNNTLFIHLDTI